MAKPDYSHWLTKQQAAEAIGVSTKTVEKLADQKQLQQAERKRPGKPAIVVFNPDDVARVAKERNPDVVPFVLPAEADIPERSESSQQSLAPVAANSLEALLTALQPKTESQRSAAYFMTLKQASEYTNLSAELLKRLCKSGQLPSVRDGGWKISRATLDGLAERLPQMLSAANTTQRS